MEYISKELRTINKKEMNPWDIAYELYKGYYTKEQIDEMLLCEINELLAFSKAVKEIK